MITTEALIEKFQYALNNKFGYIYGAVYDQWTQADQNAKVNYMIKCYGDNWKNSDAAKNNKYYGSAYYGSQWIGHIVTDCSGLFAWAFKQLGGYMYHGSNTMYREYCTSKGQLTSSLKKSLQPGTAVFTGSSETEHGHVGLYIGNGKVIEAAGAKSGVIMSNITASKWTYWGKLKGVDYDSKGETVVTPAPSTDPVQKDESGYDDLPTLRKGSKGEYVKLLQQKLVDNGYSVGSCGIDGDFGKATEKAVKAFQKDHRLTQDGVVGKKTWAALNSSNIVIPYYTVTVKHLNYAEMNKLMSEFGNRATKTIEE